MDICEEYRTTGTVKNSMLDCGDVNTLLALKLLVDEDIGNIKMQLMEAKSIAASTGHYSDAGWYRKANVARRLKARLGQKIQVLIGNRRRAFTQKHREEHVFLGQIRRGIREVLTEEQQERLWSRIREYQDETENT